VTPEASVVAAVDGVVAVAEGVAEGVAALSFGVDEHAERMPTSRTTKLK
jgi:hypothetical protein